MCARWSAGSSGVGEAASRLLLAARTARQRIALHYSPTQAFLSIYRLTAPAFPSCQATDCPAPVPNSCSTTQKMAAKYGEFTSDFKQKGWLSRTFGK